MIYLKLEVVYIIFGLETVERLVVHIVGLFSLLMIEQHEQKQDVYKLTRQKLDEKTQKEVRHLLEP